MANNGVTGKLAELKQKVTGKIPKDPNLAEAVRQSFASAEKIARNKILEILRKKAEYLNKINEKLSILQGSLGDSEGQLIYLDKELSNTYLERQNIRDEISKIQEEISRNVDLQDVYIKALKGTMGNSQNARFLPRVIKNFFRPKESAPKNGKETTLSERLRGAFKRTQQEREEGKNDNKTSIILAQLNQEINDLEIRIVELLREREDMVANLRETKKQISELEDERVGILYYLDNLKVKIAKLLAIKNNLVPQKPEEPTQKQKSSTQKAEGPTR